jgi:hypothetical protein
MTGRQLLLANHAKRRYATQIPTKPPITKNTVDDIESWPAPQMLGMKLPINPPTNPPVYVGPLRTRSSSANSTTEAIYFRRNGRTGAPLSICPLS